MRSASALFAAFFSALVLAVVATGFQAKPIQREEPCVGECVPKAELVKERKRSHRRLLLAQHFERQRNRLRARWHPTVNYALTLASLVYGVPRWQMERVAWCESRFDPFAVNGKYRGIFQLGWSPFGLSPFDPFANALSAAATVRHDGSWRQWQCKP